MTKVYDPMTEEGIALFVKKLSYRYFRQSEKLGLNDLDVEDIEQEVWITWLRCRERFDPQNDAGSGFVNYFANAAHFNMQRVLSRTVRDTVEIAPVSVHSFQDEDGTPFDDCTLRIGSDDLTPERYAQGKAMLEQVWNRFSEVTRYVLTMQLNPPKDLLDYAEAISALQQIEVSIGVRSKTCRKDVSLRLIVRYLGLPNSWYRTILDELESAKRLMK